MSVRHAGKVVLAASLMALSARAELVSEASTQSPRSGMLELRLGSFRPELRQEATLTSDPFALFGEGGLLLFSVEIDHQFFQRVGSLALGFSAGYGEKYGWATAAPSSGGQAASERVAFKLIPLRLLAVYRFDYAAIHWRVPLVPYAKGGLAYTAWWADKGGKVETVEGVTARGGKWGYAGVVGLALQLDFLEPRLARDFDVDAGVNHSYLFGEYSIDEVSNFGRPGLRLSGQQWTFGLALEY